MIRYLAAKLPDVDEWSVYDSFAFRYVPNPEAENGYPAHLNWTEALYAAQALNIDPLGHEERRKRERAEAACRVLVLLMLSRFVAGSVSSGELLEKWEAYRTAVVRAEEGLNTG